jgi:hypothetical protein
VTGYPDSEVLCAFLKALKIPGEGKYVILASSTQAPGIDKEWVLNHFHAKSTRDVSELLQGLLESYQTRNASEHSIPSLVLDSPKLKIIDMEELRNLAVEALHGRERLSAKFPDAAAVIEVSLPGYSRDRSWAILAVFVTEGPFTGEQTVVIFHRVRAKWRVEWEDVALAT